VYADGKNRYNYDAENPQKFTTALISMRAGIVAQILTMPLWVVKTRLALHRDAQGRTGTSLIFSIVKDMLLNEGPQAFFRGIAPSIFLSSYGIIQMYAYENINHMFGFSSGSQKMTWENFLVPFVTGGTAKSIASFTLMPVNVVRLRMQMKQYSKEQVDDLGLRVKDNKRQTV
jgi:hypothetical protein